jgi:hypothetical protein
MSSSAPRFAGSIVTVCLAIFAGQPAPTPQRIDAVFEADIRNFCDVLGLRKTLIEHRAQAIETSRAALLHTEPNLSPEFIAEWSMRMRTQLTPAIFIDALLPIIARYFTDDEVNRLIAYRTAVARHQPATLPPDLEKKMATVMPGLQAAFITEASRIAVKLGTDIASQIKTESSVRQ